MSSRKEKSKPAPLETGPGVQKDDNIDDLGHRPDGTEQDQPTGDDKPDNRGGRPKKH